AAGTSRCSPSQSSSCRHSLPTFALWSAQRQTSTPPAQRKRTRCSSPVRELADQRSSERFDTRRIRTMTRTVLITGSSSGIGQATAQRFATRGWQVVATARNPSALTAWASATILTLPLDVTDRASIAAAVAATTARFGSIDVLVNNAGYGLFGPLEGTTTEE